MFFVFLNNFLGRGFEDFCSWSFPKYLAFAISAVIIEFSE